jgi:hypothetical protein
MIRKLSSSALAAALVLVPISLFSQDPRFTLGVNAPGEVTGEPLETAVFSATATLTSDLETADGVEAWSLGISASGGEITSATTAGTAAALTTDGGLRSPTDGFEKTELTSGEGNAGVVSAVVLSQESPTTLPPAAASNLLRVEVEAAVPQAVVLGGQLVCTPSNVTVAFQDGLVGAGQPVANKVAYRGLDFVPVVAYATTAVCPRIETPKFDLVLSAPASVLGTAGGTVQYTATASLETSENTGPDGAEAWSISLGSTGSRIVAATVAGTAGAPSTAGGLRSPIDGFEKTQLTTGAGNEGVVSAVTLSAESPVTLPPVGSSSLLRITVEADVPEPVLSGGDYVCAPVESEVFFVDGRRGSGQPVVNRAVYRGISLVPSLGSSVTSVCPRINVPLFFFNVEAPAGVTGPAGEPVQYEALCRIRTTANTGSDGAEAWSMGVSAQNGRIVGATVEGTAGDLVANGGFRDPESGFEKTELTSGPGNEGAVSAVVLSQSNTTLPPAGTLPVLRLTVEAEAAEPGTGDAGEEVCEPVQALISYTDGLEGSGQPVVNKVSWRGVDVLPTLVAGTTDICPPLENPVLLRTDVVNPAGVAGPPAGGSTPWTVPVPAGPDTTPVTIGIVLESNLPLLPVGVRGWSMSVRTDGCFGVTGATTAGTDAAALFDQPLLKTQVVDPARNGGQEGVVSAVVISQVDPEIALPPVSESLVLLITGDMDSSAVTAPGIQSPPCGIEINPPGMDGLIPNPPATLPVKTVVTTGVDSTSRDPAVRGAEITLEGAAGGTQKPGDMNQDGEYNLSDPIATLNFLFIGGESPPPPCGDNTILDAANLTLLDSNDDGAINLSDPVYDLNFLFVGGPRPASCTDDDCVCIVIEGCPDNPEGDCAP